MNCGRIAEIAEPGRVVLRSGKEIRTGPGTVYVNCTGEFFRSPWQSGVWEDDKKLIRLLRVLLCMAASSSSLLGYLEAQFHKGKLTVEERALVTRGVPTPDTAQQVCFCLEISLRNTCALMSGPTKNLARVSRWTLRNRLFNVSHMGWGSFLKLVKAKKKTAGLAKAALKRLQEINGSEDGAWTN